MKKMVFLCIGIFCSTMSFAAEKLPPIAKGNIFNDFAFQHCSGFISMFSLLPMWRDNGVPIERVTKTLDSIILDDARGIVPANQYEADAWRNVIASSSSDMEDWHKAYQAIYSSKVTQAQIDKSWRKFCTPNTKHIFSVKDLSGLFVMPPKSTEEKTDGHVLEGKPEVDQINGVRLD